MSQHWPASISTVPISSQIGVNCQHVIEEAWPAHVDDFLREMAIYEAGKSLFSGRCIIARRDDEVVGLATLVLSPAAFDVAEFSWFAVLAERRGIGIGRQIMSTALSIAEDEQLTLIWASSVPDLYEKLGIKAVHEIAAGRHLYAVTPRRQTR